jgi:RNA polymerase sigma-70 factor (ECF subfamily)
LPGAYWLPLYVYIRRRGYRAADAEDLTQGFFAQLIEKQSVQAADRRKGRFRSFLLTAFKHFLAMNGRRLVRETRRPRRIIPLPSGTAETRYARASQPTRRIGL